MNDDQDIFDLFQQQGGEPSQKHDQNILEAIDHAASRISSRPPRRHFKFGWVIAPLAVAASLLLVPYLWQGEQEPYRNINTDSLVYPANGIKLISAPKKLSWQSQADAVGYQISLQDVNGQSIFSSVTKHPDTELILPEEIVSKLEAGKTYLWTVKLEGSLHNELGPFWFSLESTDN